MKHPNKEQQESQEQFLAELPEEQREFHARLFRLGNAAYIYHSLATNEAELVEQDYFEWLEGLPDMIQKDMKKKGFNECKGILSFTRYVNEKKDIGMGEWMKQKLSKEDYKIYCDTGNKLNSK